MTALHPIAVEAAWDDLPLVRVDDIVERLSKCVEALADAAGSFTCDEAEAIYELLLLGDPEDAEAFMAEHARGDNDDEDSHVLLEGADTRWERK